MGSLAGLLRELGHEVSGSDVRFDPPMGPALANWGVRTLTGFSPEHLAPAPDLVVVGNVCRRDNPEVVRAHELGLPVTHIAGALQRFVFGESSPLVVTGTHGKTTTSALCAYLLDKAGFAPGFLIGGIPRDLPSSFKKPRAHSPRSLLHAPAVRRNPPFVIEGDEYDTAFFEKTAKFLHYGAEVAILTSIEYDHVDIYASFDDYVAAFRRFVRQMPEHGLIVANAADPKVVEVVEQAACTEVAYYALESEATHGVAPHWVAAPAESGATGTSFDVFAGGAKCGRFAISLSGQHNVANALAALAACAQGYGAPLASLVRPLAEFSGVKRRQELVGTPRGIRVYDDFAHHPTAVSKTLAGLRRRHPQGKLLALFEAKSATACRKLHQADYVGAFAAADIVLLAPLGRDGLSEDERLDTHKLASDLVQAGKRAHAFSDLDSLVESTKEYAADGDVVAVLSNGAFGGVQQRLVAALES